LVGAILKILCPRERRVFQSKLGVSSSNQCNLHHYPHSGHLGKKNKKATIFFGHSLQQWKEWLATIPDGKLPTNQKLKDKEKTLVVVSHQQTSVFCSHDLYFGTWAEIDVKQCNIQHIFQMSKLEYFVVLLLLLHGTNLLF
jgi:hypothetical protein